jgi:hypothetical protein
VNTICVFGGLVVGSAVGGVLATHYGVTAPFWFAFGGSAVFLALLWGQLTRIAHADEHPEPATDEHPEPATGEQPEPVLDGHPASVTVHAGPAAELVPAD